MGDVRLFFQVDDLSVDEQGNPAPAGMTLTLEGVDPEPFSKVPSETLTNYVAKLTGFERDKLHILNAVEYAEMYGDERTNDDD